MTEKLDADIKAMRAISRALAELPDDPHRQRVMEWVVARGLGKSWISLPHFRWIAEIGTREEVAKAEEAAEDREAA